MRNCPLRFKDAAPTAVLVLLAILASCDGDDDSPVEPDPPHVETRVIRDVDYIKHTFFLIDHPKAFFGAFPYSVEVFVSVLPEDLVQDPGLVRFPAWAIPDSTADGEFVTAAIETLNSGGTPFPGRHQDVRLMERGTEYALLMTEDTVVVGIELKTPVPPTQLRTIAVRYRNQLDQYIGDTFNDPVDGETLVLEMIKAPDPSPVGPFGSIWDFGMRNAYYLGFSQIDPATLDVVIKDILSTRPTQSRPEGSNVPYIRIFGLDREPSDSPDGKIDNVYLNWDHDLERGILWMPVLYAFAPPAERVDVWTDGEFEFSGDYEEQYWQSRRIYIERLNALDELEVHQYLIHATVTTPAP